jgi:predicted dehydrogenase
MAPLKFAFIGCGKIAKFHADVILALGHKIMAVSAREGSKNINEFSEKYNINDKNRYINWKTMIDGGKPDAIIVAVSWNQTEKIIEDIIKTGIPCLVEKPIVLNSKKLQEIINNTRKFHNNIMIAYNRRFYDFIPKIKKVLNENKEDLLSIELNFPEATKSLSERYSEKILDHILIYMTSHWLDLLTYLIGNIEVKWMQKKTDSYNGILYSTNYDVPIHLQINFNTSSNTSITLNFKNCIYKLCPIEVLTIYKGMEIVEPTPEYPIRKYVPKTQNKIVTDTSYKPGFLKQMENFIDCFVKKNKENNIGCTLPNALQVIKLCEEIKTNETS